MLYRLSKVVPKVGDLLTQKESMINELKAQVFEDYDALLDPTEIHVREESILNASAAVDEMHSAIREEIVTRFCLRLLEEYKNIFQPGTARQSLAAGGAS